MEMNKETGVVARWDGRPECKCGWSFVMERKTGIVVMATKSPTDGVEGR